MYTHFWLVNIFFICFIFPLIPKKQKSGKIRHYFQLPTLNSPLDICCSCHRADNDFPNVEDFKHIRNLEQDKTLKGQQ